MTRNLRLSLALFVTQVRSEWLGKDSPLADQWFADFTTSTVGNSFPGSASVGRYTYDKRNQRFRTRTEMTSSFFRSNDVAVYDSVTTNTTGLNVNTTVGTGDDAVCKAMSEPYADPFAWLASARRNGSSIVGGDACDLWVGSGSMSSFVFKMPSVNMSICIAKDGSPREWNVSLVVPIGGSGQTLTQTYVFSNVTVGHITDDFFKNSNACASNYPTQACPSAGVETLNLYRIHTSTEPNDLANRNLGDALGDMAFMCEVSQQGALASNVVTWWQVDTSTDYGQYAYCLFNLHHRNECFGGTANKVGRESAQGAGMGHLQGQCSANDDVGSWYSFPAAGQCAAGQPVGTDGCTWGRARPVRTVNASCILHERGLQQACAEERSHAPFRRSTEIFRRSLASSDPSEGGCPDIGSVPTLIV